MVDKLRKHGKILLDFYLSKKEEEDFIRFFFFFLQMQLGDNWLSSTSLPCFRGALVFYLLLV
jgi:hypothetical protein